MAEDTPESALETSPEQQMREQTEKYGVAYAVFSDAFKGKGITLLTKAVGWGLIGFAVFVVIYAVWSSV